MQPEHDFVELIRRIRAGDERACTELVRRYEPAIRVAVRARLTDPALRRVMDSMDVCQSVLGIFFARAASGHFELDRPEQLVNLLVTMARNRVVNHAHYQQAACRDQRRSSGLGTEADELADPAPGPSVEAEHRDLVDAVRDRLSPEEWQVAERWSAGEAWNEIGAQVGCRPDTLRVRLARALLRIRGDSRLSG